MKITRQNLIELCDKFFNDKIDKAFLQDFAWNVITTNDTEWEEDDVISETIFEWDNEEIAEGLRRSALLVTLCYLEKWHLHPETSPIISLQNAPKLLYLSTWLVTLGLT